MNLKTLLYFYPINKVTHCYDVVHKPVGLSQDEWNHIIKSHKHVCGFKKIPFKHLKSEDKQKVIKYALMFIHKKIKGSNINFEKPCSIFIFIRDKLFTYNY